MADQTERAAEPGEHSFGKCYTFSEVFTHEVEFVNARRARQAEEIRGVVTPDAEGREQRGAFQLEIEAGAETDVAGHPAPELRGRANAAEQQVLRPPQSANVVGLALSGGGIRSAAFCLGVLQALDRTRVLDRVDYMSTVSGGGYVGCSLTAALESTGQFPFTSRLEEDEPPALQQIRDYSNYLFPSGQSHNVLRNASIYARGLAVNVVLVAQFLFAASALTLLYYSLRGEHSWMHFILTVWLAAIVFAAGIVWGLVKSVRPQPGALEYAGQEARAVGWLIVVLFAVGFCELQPFILDAMLHKGTSNVADVVTDWINTISAILAPVGAAMAYLANKLGEYVKSTMQSPQWSGPVKAAVLKAAIVVGGLILPLGVWVVYLDVTYWGICINAPSSWCTAPGWLASSAHAVFPWHGYAAAALYASIAVASLLLSLPMQPNANSLHALYRDRLRKAFLFVPQPKLEDHDLPMFTTPLSKITGRHGPYHLINAALNVEASKTANRRGRNADFFIFTPLFVGSKTTGYVFTDEMEDVLPSLNLATAMATSGAAVSSNMGKENIKPLTATLALLNIRLGYWMRNPLKVHKAKPSERPGWFSEFRRHFSLFANYYFLLEMFGLLSEKRKSVYLTDGGHIENLGIYELLRRRCRVIIAVDAEADPQMAFGSFNTLERYALIDLGIRVDLPWEQIATASLATSQAIDKAGDVSAGPTNAEDQTGEAPGKKTADAPGDKAGAVPKHRGPHCAVGEISYPGDRKGILIYIKASLTGDENDYIFDYKKRYSAFPHETTLDQMFTEEQFEAYRALGFHAAFNLFDRSDQFAHLGADRAEPQLKLLDQLFPRAPSEGRRVDKPKFVDWLPKAKAPGKPRKGAPKLEVEPS